MPAVTSKKPPVPQSHVMSSNYEAGNESEHLT